MAQDTSTRNSPAELDGIPTYDEFDPAVDTLGPSLPIVLISAACGIAGGVIGLYVSYSVLGWDIRLAVFLAVLCMSVALGVVGAGLSALSGSRAAGANIGLSCGLIGVALLFFGLCTLVGALTATVLVLGMG